MKAMLDTNTCIYAMKRTPGFNPKLPLRDCGISVIVLGDLEWGVMRSARIDENNAALSDWLAAMRVANLTNEVARRYGALRAALYAAGRPVGPNDLWIAAHAVALDLPLITHNLDEFRHVPELAVETWLDENR